MPAVDFSPLSFSLLFLAEQAQCRLWLGIRLRQNGDTGLLENRVPRQLRGFVGDVDVADARLGSTQVLACDGEVVDRATETVLHRAERTT